MKQVTKVEGSIQDRAEKSGIPMEMAMMDAKHIILIDTSGSMMTMDAGHNQREARHDVAARELEKLQQQLPGKIVVLSFSSDVVFCPGGVPIRQNMGTNIMKALETIKPFDGTDVKFYLISDGEDQNDLTIELAKTFETPIHCIYIGSENIKYGAETLRKISEASRGKYATSAKVAEFEKEVKALMEGNNGNN